MSYLSKITPKEEDIVVVEGIEVDYIISEYGVEVIW